MALPTFVSAGAIVGSANAPTVALPSGWQEGDILIIFVEYANEANIAVPSGGWARVADAPQGTGTSGTTSATKLDAFWKRATALESNVVLSDAGNHTIACMIAIRGAIETGDPWDVTSGNVKTPASTSISITGDTTTVNDCLVIIAASRMNDAAGEHFSNIVNADLANISKRLDDGATNGNGGGLLIVTGEKATAGSYGATTADISVSTVNGFMTIAIKSAVAPSIALNTTDGFETTDTTPTIEFTGTDPQAEDIIYEVEIDSNPQEIVVGEFSNATIDTGGFLYAAFPLEGQTFKPTSDGQLLKMRFWLKRTGSPTGNAVAALYGHQGAYGTGGMGVDPILAVSDPVDISGVSTSVYEMVEFTFPSSQRVLLEEDNPYIASVIFLGGDASNYLVAGGDFSSPTHDGNRTYVDGSVAEWRGYAAADISFQVLCSGRTTVSYVSDVASGFVNTVNGADTSPFTSGQKISFTFPTLALGKYNYRVRGKDPAGSNVFGSWSAYRSFAIFPTDRELSTTVRETIPTTNDGHLISDVTSYAADQDGYDNIDSSDNLMVVVNGIEAKMPYVYQKVKFDSQQNFKVLLELQENLEGQVGGTPTIEVAPTSVGTANWTTPTNAFADDDAYAVTVGTTTQRFVFPSANIPVDATITEIRIRTRGHANVANGSTIGWTIGDGLGSSWGIQDTTHNLGSDTTSTTSGNPLFNSDLTPTDFNSGLVYAEGQPGSGTNTLNIDQVVFVISYTVPSRVINVDLWDDELSSWENVWTSGDHLADTEVADEVHKSANLSKYFDATFWVTARIYLDHEATLRVDQFTIESDTTTTKSITAKASIQKSFTKTVTAKARIEIPRTKTITAKGNILVVIHTTRTIEAKGRIESSATQTVTAKGSIGMFNTETIEAKARILTHPVKTLTAKGRIGLGNEHDITAKARIERFETKTLQAKARIKTTQSYNITAKARIGGFVSPAIVQSEVIANPTFNIVTATLTAVDFQPANTDITYFLSNDNGVTWEEVTSGVEHTFTSEGNLLKWRAILEGTRQVSPYIETVSVDWTLDEFIHSEQTITAKGRIELGRTQTITAKGRIEAVSTKTVTAKGRIEAPATQTISAKGRIEIATTQSITAKGSIKVSQTKTVEAQGSIKKEASHDIDALANIRATETIILTAKGRINVPGTRTIDAGASIEVNQSKTITAKGNIVQSQVKTINAKASIVQGIEQTISAGANIRKSQQQSIDVLGRIEIERHHQILSKGRIEVSSTKSISAKARIEQGRDKTITAKGRIEVTIVKSVTAKGNIFATTVQTISARGTITSGTRRTVKAKANIFATVQRTGTAKASIQKSFTKIVSAKARIEIAHTTTISALGRITKQEVETITTKARIEVSQEYTVNAKARIEFGETIALTAKARIEKQETRTVTARGRILLSEEKTISAKGSIERSFEYEITAKGRIALQGTKTITAKARIFKIVSKTVTAKARINIPGGRNIDAKARIEVSETYSLTAKARISRVVQQQVNAKGRIGFLSTQSVQAKATIQTLSAKTVTAKARIETIETVSLIAKGNIRVEQAQQISAKAVIQIAGGRTIRARANIRGVQTQNITSKGSIERSRQQSINAKARISILHEATVNAKALITGKTTQTIETKANILATREKTISAKAYLTLDLEVQTISAKARIFKETNVEVVEIIDTEQTGVTVKEITYPKANVREISYTSEE